MRNLLGRLHARTVPELLRIAAAWSVPPHAQSKGEIVSALYRTMSDPSAMRDVWSDLDQTSRSLLLALAESPDAEATPTLRELATRLGGEEASARETAVALYRAGILAREGDDDPLPVGVAPRLLLPRELATNIRRIQDEIAAGNLAHRPLRVLIELLEDAEIEEAAAIWGWRPVPGVEQRTDIARRLMRMVSDPERIRQVTGRLGRDAAAIWRTVRTANEPILLGDVLAQCGLGGSEPAIVARRRSALDELETALLVWHTYSGDGERWLFVPPEIRSPRRHLAPELPPLVALEDVPEPPERWQHPDAVAWDLMTLLRVVADRHAPSWEPDAPLPRWLRRSLAGKLWITGEDGPPAGYLELLQALGLAESVLSANEQVHPHRIEPSREARSWRSLPFPAQTMRLRHRWLRLPTWVEGASADLLDIWGADWKGFRPRLLHALASQQLGLAVGEWVPLESLSERVSRANPALLGRSFVAASARNDNSSDRDEEARANLLREIVSIELSGPLSWFGLVELRDVEGKSTAVRLTRNVLAAVSRQQLEPDADTGAGEPALTIAPGGDVSLLTPTPSRVWALGAIAELVELGQVARYRVTAATIAMAADNGIEPGQIVTFLEQASRSPLPDRMASDIVTWVGEARRARLTRLIQIEFDDAEKCQAVCHSLMDNGWNVRQLDERLLIVAVPGEDRNEDALSTLLRARGIEPAWSGEASAESLLAAESDGQLVLSRADDGA
ncbi:MAG: helicase-associated domain-containing protein [Thermomicrobiales bacterium]